MGTCASPGPTTRAQIVSAILRTPLVLSLNRLQIDELARGSRVYRFAKGDMICQDGERPKGAYLLLEGKVAVQMRLANQESKGADLCVVKEAPWLFMEPVLWTEKCDLDSVHSSAVEAAAPMTVVAMVPVRTAGHFRKRNLGAQAKIKAIFDQGIQRQLKKIDFLSTVSEDKLAVLAGALKYRVLEPGEVLFHEGSRGSEFYILYQGKVDILKTVAARDGAEPAEKRVAVLGAGKFFGEITLLTDMPRTATVVGSQDTKCTVLFYIGKREFKECIRVLKLDFLSIMKERICDQFRSTDCAFFKTFPHARMAELARVCELNKVQPDEFVFRDGDPGGRFYIIVGGAISIVKEGKQICRLGPKQYFGEIALISESPRTAGARALATSLLLSMTKAHFRQFFFDRPESLAEVELKILGKRATIRSVIYHREGYAMFEAYLKEQFASESLSFWKDARAYRHMFDHVYEKLRRESAVGLSPRRHSPQHKVGPCSSSRSPRRVAVASVTESATSPSSGEEKTAAVTRSPSSSRSARGRRGRGHARGHSRAGSGCFSIHTPGNSPPVSPMAQSRGSRRAGQGRRMHTLVFESNALENGTIPEHSEPALTPAQVEQMRRAAQSLYEKYIEEGSERQVNIPGTAKERIEKALSAGDIDTRLFADAEREVIKLLARDKFSDFKASRYFSELINTVCRGTYKVEDQVIRETRRLRRKSTRTQSEVPPLRGAGPGSKAGSVGLTTAGGVKYV